MRALRAITSADVVFTVRADDAGIKRIRHYGVLASACKADKPAQARLQVLQCPCCKANSLQVVATLAGARRLPAPGDVARHAGVPQPRGPP